MLLPPRHGASAVLHVVADTVASADPLRTMGYARAVTGSASNIDARRGACGSVILPSASGSAGRGESLPTLSTVLSRAVGGSLSKPDSRRAAWGPRARLLATRRVEDEMKVCRCTGDCESAGVAAGGSASKDDTSCGAAGPPWRAVRSVAPLCARLGCCEAPGRALRDGCSAERSAREPADAMRAVPDGTRGGMVPLVDTDGGSKGDASCGACGPAALRCAAADTERAGCVRGDAPCWLALEAPDTLRAGGAADRGGSNDEASCGSCGPALDAADVVRDGGVVDGGGSKDEVRLGSCGPALDAADVVRDGGVVDGGGSNDDASCGGCGPALDAADVVRDGGVVDGGGSNDDASCGSCGPALDAADVVRDGGVADGGGSNEEARRGGCGPPLDAADVVRAGAGGSNGDARWGACGPADVAVGDEPRAAREVEPRTVPEKTRLDRVEDTLDRVGCRLAAGGARPELAVAVVGSASNVDVRRGGAGPEGACDAPALARLTRRSEGRLWPLASASRDEGSPGGTAEGGSTSKVLLRRGAIASPLGSALGGSTSKVLARRGGAMSSSSAGPAGAACAARYAMPAGSSGL